MRSEKFVRNIAKDFVKAVLTEDAPALTECMNTLRNIVAKDNEDALGGFNVYGERGENSFLMECIQNTNAPCVIKLLVRHPAFDINVNQPNRRNNMPLHCAVMRKDPRFTRYLVEGGALINFTNKYGKTALMEACYFGNEGAVEILLDQPNIDLYARSSTFLNAADYARLGNNPHIVELLRDKENQLLKKRYAGIRKFDEITPGPENVTTISQDSKKRNTAVEEFLENRKRKALSPLHCDETLAEDCKRR